MARFGALVLAAGKGTRMQTEIHKQFLMLDGKPLFIHSTEKLLKYAACVIVVTGEEDIPTCESCLKEAGLAGRVRVVRGGKERFESSMNGLKALREEEGITHVMIHDAARPFVTDSTILDVMEKTEKYSAAIAAVPSKDTVKIVDENGFVRETPDRNRVYNVQTPQGFSLELILKAYARMADSDPDGLHITDDAMVIEHFTDVPVCIAEGTYGNIKITTPEDLKQH